MFAEDLLLARWQAHKLAGRGYYRLVDPCTQAFTFRGPRYGHPSNYARVVLQCMPAERLSLEPQASWPVAVSVERGLGGAVASSEQ